MQHVPWRMRNKSKDSSSRPNATCTLKNERQWFPKEDEEFWQLIYFTTIFHLVLIMQSHPTMRSN